MKDFRNSFPTPINFDQKGNELNRRHSIALKLNI